jgi:hypothetical protein
MALSKSTLNGFGVVDGLADAEHSIFITIMAAAINNQIFNNIHPNKWIATTETRIERNIEIPNDNSTETYKTKLIRVPDIIVWNRKKLDEGAIKIPEIFIEIEQFDNMKSKIEKAETLFNSFSYWQEGFVMIYDTNPIQFYKFTRIPVSKKDLEEAKPSFSNILDRNLLSSFKHYWNLAFK